MKMTKETMKSLSEQAYFEHRRTTTFAKGESSGNQFFPLDEESFSISSASSPNELKVLFNHLNDPSLRKPLNKLLVLLSLAMQQQHPLGHQIDQ